MLFDINNLFWHAGTTYAFTSGEFASFATLANSSASAVITLPAAEDLGIGDGEYIPKVAAIIGTAFTSSSSTLTLNFQFQGSTDNTTWTTYAETGPNTTASYAAGQYVLPIDVPKRKPGTALPAYYRLRLETGATGGATIATGTILAGIVIQRSDYGDTGPLYPSGFSVA